MTMTIHNRQVIDFLEWDQQDPTRSSWVSPMRKYFFVGLGKTASTRIKLNLHILEGYTVVERPYPWLHARDREGAAFVPKLADFDIETANHILTSPEWFRFCFVRNPYDRLLSAYKSCIMQEMNPPSPYYNAIKDEIRRKFTYSTRAKGEGGTISFQDFVQYLQDNKKHEMDYHWCSLRSGLRPDLVSYDFVGYFEHLYRDLRRVFERLDVEETMAKTFYEPINQSNSGKIPLAAFYNWCLAEQVYEMYKEDFESYGYEKNSWLFQ